MSLLLLLECVQGLGCGALCQSVVLLLGEQCPALALVLGEQCPAPAAYLQCLLCSTWCWCWCWYRSHMPRCTQGAVPTVPRQCRLPAAWCHRAMHSAWHPVPGTWHPGHGEWCPVYLVYGT